MLLFLQCHIYVFFQKCIEEETLHFIWLLKRWYRKQSWTTVDISVKSFKCPQMRLKIHLPQKLCGPRQCLHGFGNPAKLSCQYVCYYWWFTATVCEADNQSLTHKSGYLTMKRKDGWTLCWCSLFFLFKQLLTFLNFSLLLYFLLINLLIFWAIWISAGTMNYPFFIWVASLLSLHK